MKFLIILTLAILFIGCEKSKDNNDPQDNVTANSGQYKLIRQYDCEYNVVCYRFFSFEGTSCVKLEGKAPNCQVSK